jgi:Holliday junction resolvasome RuvABC DNA-binding subunit
MIREDLICALRNAIERGSSLEEAITSLVNAGYNRIEIEEASKQLRNVRKKGSFLPPPPRRK